MKKHAAVIIALAASSSISSAQTADEVLMKSARSIARISLIEPTCGPFYLLDRKLLNELSAAFVQDAIDRFGVQIVKRMVDRVRPEFLSIIRREGAATWCPAQSAFYKQPGHPEFIGSPLE